jgi:hypothetical protein
LFWQEIHSASGYIEIERSKAMAYFDQVKATLLTGDNILPECGNPADPNTCTNLISSTPTCIHINKIVERTPQNF